MSPWPAIDHPQKSSSSQKTRRRTVLLALISPDGAQVTFLLQTHAIQKRDGRNRKKNTTTLGMRAYKPTPLLCSVPTSPNTYEKTRGCSACGASTRAPNTCRRFPLGIPQLFSAAPRTEHSRTSKVAAPRPAQADSVYPTMLLKHGGIDAVRLHMGTHCRTTTTSY